MLEGSRRANKRAPATTTVDGLEAPEWFSPWQRAAWDRVIGLLGPLRVLTAADWPIVETLATALDLHEQTSRQIAAEGATQTTARGESKLHPAVRARASAAAEIHHLARVLGLDLPRLPRLPREDRRFRCRPEASVRVRT